MSFSINTIEVGEGGIIVYDVGEITFTEQWKIPAGDIPKCLSEGEDDKSSFSCTLIVLSVSKYKLK